MYQNNMRFAGIGADKFEFTDNDRSYQQLLLDMLINFIKKRFVVNNRATQSITHIAEILAGSK